jgi:hypothetical protein
MAADSKLTGILLSGTFAARPAANTVAGGTLYSATDTGVIYQSDGSSWTTYATTGSGYTDPLTTRGDLVKRGVSATERLAIGAANRLLRSDGTDPSWGQVVEADLNLTDLTTANVSTSKHGLAPKAPNDATKYLDGTGAYSVPAGGGGGYTQGARVYNSGALSIANSTATALTFDSERYDTDTCHSTSSNTSRLTATTAGKYHIGGAIDWAANDTGIRQCYVRLNGSTIIAVQTTNNTGAGNNCQMVVGTIYDLSATDYVELIALQTSGGSLNVAANANYSPEFYVQRIG